VVVGLALVVVLVVVVGLLGGWARDSAGVRRVAAGEDVAVTPFVVRIDSAAAVYEYDGRIADDGTGLDPTTDEDDVVPQAFLVVDGRISLDDDESVSSLVLNETFAADLERTFTTSGVQLDSVEPEIDVSGDGSSLLGIGPGLTYSIRLVYVVADAEVPDVLDLTLLEHSRRASSLDGTEGWLDTAPAAQLSLPVAPLPAERPVEEDGL